MSRTLRIDTARGTELPVHLIVLLYAVAPTQSHKSGWALASWSDLVRAPNPGTPCWRRKGKENCGRAAKLDNMQGATAPDC